METAQFKLSTVSLSIACSINVAVAFCTMTVHAQSGPPELVNPDRDPFIHRPVERKPSPATESSKAAAVALQAKLTREDSVRLLDLTTQVHKAIDAGGTYMTDARTVRWLEEIEKTAKRMRKRIAR